LSSVPAGLKICEVCAGYETSFVVEILLEVPFYYYQLNSNLLAQ